MEKIVNSFSTQPIESIVTIMLIILVFYGVFRLIDDIGKFFSKSNEEKLKESVKTIEKAGGKSIDFDYFYRDYQYESDLLHTAAIIYANNNARKRTTSDSVEDAERLIRTVRSLLEEQRKGSEKELSESLDSVSKEDKIKNVIVTTGAN